MVTKIFVTHSNSSVQKCCSKFLDKDDQKRKQEDIIEDSKHTAT